MKEVYKQFQSISGAGISIIYGSDRRKEEYYSRDNILTKRIQTFTDSSNGKNWIREETRDTSNPFIMHIRKYWVSTREEFSNSICGLGENSVVNMDGGTIFRYGDEDEQQFQERLEKKSKKAFFDLKTGTGNGDRNLRNAFIEYVEKNFPEFSEERQSQEGKRTITPNETTLNALQQGVTPYQTAEARSIEQQNTELYIERESKDD